MPQEDGFYFDIYQHPLSGSKSLAEIKTIPLPDPGADWRFTGLQESILTIAEQVERAVTVGNMSSGIFQLLFYLRGYENAYLDWVSNQPLTQTLLHRLLDMQILYWDRIFTELEDIPFEIVETSDDLAGQSRMLISPESYRKHLKPLH